MFRKLPLPRQLPRQLFDPGQHDAALRLPVTAREDELVPEPIEDDETVFDTAAATAGGSMDVDVVTLASGRPCNRTRKEVSKRAAHSVFHHQYVPLDASMSTSTAAGSDYVDHRRVTGCAIPEVQD